MKGLNALQIPKETYPVRKSPRIPQYDYSTVNSYFVTICTHERRCIFYTKGTLNRLGLVAQDCLLEIPKRYVGYRIDKFVVMPNHIHAIITIDTAVDKNLSYVIGQYKSVVSKGVHQFYPELEVWQRSFHDHVIRNQKRYDLIWNYIENNPMQWKEDCFYLRDT